MAGEKVFSLEWADDSRFHIVSFKHEPWKAEFLMLETIHGN